MSKEKYIIEKSINLFVENGVYKTSTKMILDETGLSNGGLFNYFKNKNSIVQAAYINCKVEMLNNNHALIANSTTPKEIIKSLFCAVIKWGLENPTYHLFMRQVANEPFIREYNFKQDYQDYQPIIDKLTSAINSNEIVIWDTFSFLLNIYSLTEAILDYLHVNSNINQDEYIDFCFEQYYSGIKFNT